MEIKLIFRKLEGYNYSGIGSRSVSVDRLTGRQKRDLVWIFKLGMHGLCAWFLEITLVHTWVCVSVRLCVCFEGINNQWHDMV